jgi:histone H3/H4
VGGRFVLTLEEGQPLTPAECRAMPDADTVRLIGMSALVGLLREVGLELTWQQDCSRSHLTVVDALLAAFTAQASQIAATVGRRAVDELLAAHRLWSDWLRRGRVRKLALVASKRDGP